MQKINAVRKPRHLSISRPLLSCHTTTHVPSLVVKDTTDIDTDTSPNTPTAHRQNRAQTHEVGDGRQSSPPRAHTRPGLRARKKGARRRDTHYTLDTHTHTPALFCFLYLLHIRKNNRTASCDDCLDTPAPSHQQAVLPLPRESHTPEQQRAGMRIATQGALHSASPDAGHSSPRARLQRVSAARPSRQIPIHDPPSVTAPRQLCPNPAKTGRYTQDLIRLA